MSDRVIITQLIAILLGEEGRDKMTKEQVQDLMVRLGMSKGDAAFLIENLSVGCDSNVDMSAFVSYIFGADGAAAAYLANHGIVQPSESDIAYFQDQHVKDFQDRHAIACNQDFLKAVIMEKPTDLPSFAVDFFAGTLASEKRLVLISSDAGQVDVLRQAVRPIGNMGAEIITATWDFNGTPTDMIGMMAALVQKHGLFKTVALCCHRYTELDQNSPLWKRAQWEAAGKPVRDGKPDKKAVRKFLASSGPVEVRAKKWQLLQSHGVDLHTGEEDPGFGDVLKVIAEAASVRVDILACGLAATEQGRMQLQKWEKETGKNFAASTDFTGNAQQGGNWLLETDGIDLCEIYFDAYKLKPWKQTLHHGKSSLQLSRPSNYADIDEELHDKGYFGNFSNNANTEDDEDNIFVDGGKNVNEKDDEENADCGNEDEEGCSTQ